MRPLYLKVPEATGESVSTVIYPLDKSQVVRLAEEDHKQKFFYMADPACRENRTAVP